MIYEAEVEYNICALPEDDENYLDFVLRVRRLSRGWTLRHGGLWWHFGRGEWVTFDPEYVATSKKHALACARLQAPEIRVNGVTAAEYLERKRQMEPYRHDGKRLTVVTDGYRTSNHHVIKFKGEGHVYLGDIRALVRELDARSVPDAAWHHVQPNSGQTVEWWFSWDDDGLGGER